MAWVTSHKFCTFRNEYDLNATAHDSTGLFGLACFHHAHSNQIDGKKKFGKMVTIYESVQYKGPQNAVSHSCGQYSNQMPKKDVTTSVWRINIDNKVPTKFNDLTKLR
jgi:hypothetical protein